MNGVPFCEGTTELVNKDRETHIVYLDFCKVFDTVPHIIFVAELERHGWMGHVVHIDKE